MQIVREIKTILLSVIEDGCSSKRTNEFLHLCRSIALSYLKTNKYSKEIIKKEGITEEELSYDLIADLFAEKSAKYYQIENYFRETDILSLKEEEITAMLVVLIRSRGLQRISEIREEQGEIYFKIKKSFDSYLQRNKEEISIKTLRDKEYVYIKDIIVKDSYTPLMPEDELLNELFAKEFKNYMVPEVSRLILEILSSQNQYCKAFEKTHFINILSEFYKRRLKDEIYSKNADYFNYK